MKESSLVAKVAALGEDHSFEGRRRRRAGTTLSESMAAVEPHPLVDPTATARLYDLHYERVLSFCLWRLGRREDAEDAAQTTFLNAHRALGRGTTPRSEGSWLLAI